MTKQRKYSAEFKREAVALTQQPGVSCRLLNRWKREAEQSQDKGFQGTGSPRDEEMARLKRELAKVKKERDFLREAATFFAKELP